MKIKKVFLVQLISGLLVALIAKTLFSLNIVAFILFILGMLLSAIIGTLFYVMSGSMNADKEKELKLTVLNEEDKISKRLLSSEKI